MPIVATTASARGATVTAMASMLLVITVIFRSVSSEATTLPTAPFWPVASYLNQFGIAPENELSVNFDGGRVTLHDGAAYLYGGYKIMPIDNSKSDGFLKHPGGPNITWPEQVGMQYAVIFVDLGPGSGKVQTTMPTFYPFIHSFWANCKGGSLATCALGPEPFLGVPEGYRAPGNFLETANRYTFILFEAPKSAAPFTLNGLKLSDTLGTKMAELKARVLRHEDVFPRLSFLMDFDFAKFARENPEYQATRWNYMMVNIPRQA